MYIQTGEFIVTTIVFDSKILASDSQMTKHGHQIVQGEAVKLFTSTSMFKGNPIKGIGVAGVACIAEPFIAWINSGADLDDWEDEYEDVQAIIVTSGDTWLYEYSKYPLKANEIVTIGSGATFAASAVSLNETAINAVRHAIKHDIYSSGTIRYIDCTQDSPVLQIAEHQPTELIDSKVRTW